MSENAASVRSYRPGSWFGILGERALVILPPSEKARVASLWELVDDGAGFDVTLDALISGGLRELPSFVLVSTTEGETKVVLRGPARAVFTVDGEQVELEGSSATTWVERSLQGVERMSITVDDQDAETASYSVDGGLFRISALEEGPVHEGAPEYEPGPDVDHVALPALPEDGDGIDGDDPEPSSEALEVAHTEAEEDAPSQEHPEPPAEEPSGLDALLGGPRDAEPSRSPAAWSGARSPEPPSWTPPPVTGALPPTPAAWGAPDELPQTEAMTAPPQADHDDAILAGTWQPEAPPAPGSTGQQDVPQPVARLVISNGESVDVDRPIVIGRAPEARRFSTTEQPRLVTVPSPHLEISSAHLEVRPGTGADEGSALVTDLSSTNGTVLVQPGLAPEDLEPGVPVRLVPGAVIDLGDGVTIQVLQH